ncbi:hypothetical protein FHR99_001963 [Litorivivens lipolytica]|uniref:Uncharacterized protein n=1 Tax=Litorivivens lipolytica TaxID=1524264 RepID=A0A7W4W6E8_9GAMM|nr:hypothetical protein [Litorivivens lipolytica]MBB3047697.1 hypothetical protein [Litorivivens lipolytica]
MGDELVLTPELRHLKSLLQFSSPLLRSRFLAEVPLRHSEQKIPLQVLELGSEAADVPVPTLAEYYALYKLLHRTYPHMDYIFEPQSRHYITHGDLLGLDEFGGATGKPPAVAADAGNGVVALGKEKPVADSQPAGFVQSS